MIKNRYIAWILFIIIVITLFNLFYKYIIFERPIASLNTFYFNDGINFVSKGLCPVQGLKCANHDNCDCKQLCGNDYVKFTVSKEDNIYIMNRKLTPGIYCLPRGIHKCNFNATMPIFSLTGWVCVPMNSSIYKNNKIIACKSDDAKDNDLNMLWDHLENRPAEKVENYFEQYNGDYRYKCKCESTSLDGTPMVSPVPFMCLVDYCIRDFKQPYLGMGWNGSECDCKMYPHLIDNDKTSPCLKVAPTLENNLFTGRVMCMNKDSFIEKSLYCPTDADVLSFQVPLIESWNKTPSEYIGSLIEPSKYGLNKNVNLENFYENVEMIF